jgi:hypothetical protein
MGQARLGWRSPHRLSAGVELGLFQDQLATKQWTAATEVTLVDGHEGTTTFTTIAVELGFADCVIVLRDGAKFPALWTRKTRAPNLWEVSCATSRFPSYERATSAQAQRVRTRASVPASSYS